MNLSMILAIIFIGFFIVEGLYSIVTGRMLGDKKDGTAKYEEKSYALYCRISGVFMLIGAFGIFLFRQETFNISIGIPAFVGYILVGLSIAFLIVGMFTIPKKLSLEEQARRAAGQTGSGSGSEGSGSGSTVSDDKYIDED